MTNVDSAYTERENASMGMKTFKNGVTDNGPQRRYKLSATLIGIRIVPTLGSEGSKMQMLYEEFENFVTDEEKVAEEVNKFILNKTTEKSQNLLIWDFKNDMAYKELRQILVGNTQLERKFDGRQ